MYSVCSMQESQQEVGLLQYTVQEECLGYKGRNAHMYCKTKRKVNFKKINKLKGQCHEIFHLGFFS
jgi:hypothetical protein